MPLRLFAAATLPSICAAVLIGVRPWLGTGWPWLWFNLFLAWLPVLFAAAVTPTRRLGFALPWLAFFPNAPYLLSDMIHYKHRPPVPSWFDAAMLGSVGAAGLIGGAVSAVWIGRCLAARFGGWATAVAWIVVCVLSGRAIELGRVDRLNSWDLILDPLPVLVDLLAGVTDPAAHLETWGITALYAAIIATWSGSLWLVIPRQYEGAPPRGS